MRERPDFDSCQLRAIETRGKDVIVSASAGSGKTTVMIERILRLIEEGEDLKRMLVVTFTRAAAADMRAKLFRALRQQSENVYCARALDDLSSAQISTLHSFCGNVARTYFYAIGLDPSFTLLDEKDGALFSRCLDEICEDLSESGDMLYEMLLSSRKDKKYKAALSKVCKTAMSMPDPEGWLESCTDGYDDDTEAKKIIADDFAEKRKKLCVSVKDCLTRCLQAEFSRNVDALNSVVSALESGRAELPIPSPRTRVPSEFFDLNEEFKQLRGQAEDLLKKERESKDLAPSAWAKPFASSLVSAARRVMELYGSEKKKKAKADYNDLEHYAYEILQTPSGDKVRDAFDYIFVDEYQDINPLQDAIISLVKKEGNLFMVGDLKQSIYAFRGCQPAIFAEKYARFKNGGGEAVELNKNFRTEQKIIDKVNAVFCECMSEGFGGVNYRESARLVATRKNGGYFRYANVIAEKQEPPAVSSPVYRISEHEFIDESTAVGAQSDYVVERILELLTYDGEDGRAEPRDIAVLARSNSNLTRMIREKLSRAGIPVFLKEETSPAVRPEIAPIVSLLSLTDNPEDDVELAAALLGYVGGFKSDDLAAALDAAGAGASFKEAIEGDEKFAPFMSRLSGYIAAAQSVSVSELLSRMAVDTDAFVKVRKLYGEDGERALSAFLAMASNETQLAEFLEKIKQSPFECASSNDSVRIMTVHMSKGLEFDYVFYVGAEKEFNMTDFRSPYLIDPRFGAVIKAADETSRKFVPTFLSEAAEIVRKRGALEEEMRIAYVAATRAKKGLEIVGANIKPPSLKQKISLPTRPCDFFAALTPTAVRPDGAETDIAPPEAVKVYVGGDERLAEKIREKIDFVYPFARVRAKTTVSDIIREEDDGYFYGEPEASLSEEDARVRTSGSGSFGAERGTAFHLFFRELDFFADFDKQAAAFSEKFPKEAALVDFEKAKVCHRLVSGIADGYKLQREREFVFDKDGTLVQGVIDLLAVGDGGALVIDYKTGRDPRDPRYRAQLDLYAEAVEKILRIKVKEKYICAVDCGELIALGRESR